MKTARRSWIWPWMLIIAIIVAEGVAALTYAIIHPWMTQIEVLLSAGEWALPWRWFG